MAPNTRNPKSSRIKSLDSLRGIAALAVLLGHTIAMADWNADFSKLFLINNLFDGRSAVTMFFVLSGFVLTVGALLSERRLVIPSFYLKRITRIWLPWACVFGISIIAKNVVFFTPSETSPPISSHHASVWSGENSAITLLKQAVYSTHDVTLQYLPQDWSLGIELKASILIPFILFLAKKQWLSTVALTIGIMVFRPESYNYASFTVGVMIAALHAKSQNAEVPMFKSGAIPGGLIALVGFLAYQARWACNEWQLFPSSPTEPTIWMTTSLGCALIILGILNSNSLKSLMEHPALQFLGRISYSLFLIHVLILVCLAPWFLFFLNQLGLHHHAGLQLLLVSFVVMISLILAHFSEKWIEVPCINLGNHLARRIESFPRLSRWRV